jgi:lipid A 3-O-deacylase
VKTIPTTRTFILPARRAALLVATALLPLLPHARGGSEEPGGTFSVYMENDLFAGTDRQYTSGVKFGWSSADLASYADSPYASPFLPLFNVLPYINEKAYQKNLVFALGQNIYTPDDTEVFAPVKGDRPYAGWLYAGVGVVWKNAEVRNSLVLNVGVVGSWSYAQEAQRLVHDLRRLGHPKGWDNQLHNELGVVATYQRQWRWPRHERRVGLDWEFIPHLGVALGNVQTYANLGGELRVGLNLPDDFGTAAIDPAATTSTPVDGRQGAERSRFDLGLYVFARADGRVVAHNIFLDGNTFGDSPSVDRKWLVADLSVGAAVNYKNTKFAYAFVYRTEEFRGQTEPQIFGTISVNLAF